MIIRESENSFIMVAQHDHASLSGQIAAHFKKEFFIEEVFFDDVVLAVQEHDRSWIGLDDTPLWNDRRLEPISFMDYPKIPKLTFYSAGLDETEIMNPYAALLCSLHYTSFYAHSQDKEITQFLNNERERQSRIMATVPHISEKTISYHFRLLQLCDDLSLYVCLNEPGVSKEEEHKWYRKGFKNSEIFSVNHEFIKAEWKSKQHVSIHDFPFEQDFQAQIAIKHILKSERDKEGVEQAYHQAELNIQPIWFIR